MSNANNRIDIKYPIISYLMCVRVRTDLSKPNVRDIVKFFRDAIDYIYPEDRKKLEFLIKFDSDDTYAPKVWNSLKDSPFNIRTFTFWTFFFRYFLIYFS